MRGLLTLLATVLTLLAAPKPGLAQSLVRTVLFSPATGFVPSAERGFYIHPGSDFLGSTVSGEAFLTRLRGEGFLLVFAMVRLDAWRGADLPSAFLTLLEESLQNARRAGVKLILRFSYNDGPLIAGGPLQPDAPLARVLRHIDQLGPVLARHRDTLAVIQAGFIGQWGEGHGSTNDLTLPANRDRIRDALLARFPADTPLQWRRPPDLMAWTTAQRGRFGFHNDCFLSGPDDAGTFVGTAAEQVAQRAFAADLTDRTPFTAETCVLSTLETQARRGCWAILSEGAQFHLSMLNATFHPSFHDTWQAEDCRELVENRLGYRLRLDYAALNPNTRWLTVWVANDGWSRLHSSRRLTATHWRSGQSLGTITLGGNRLLSQVGPGESLDFWGQFTTWPRRNDVICLSAPDPRPEGASVTWYAVRFANADRAGHSWWDPRRAAFCYLVP